MRLPDIYNADAIKRWDVEKNGGNDYWYLARPLGMQTLSLRQRFKVAWGVFTGRYDALKWRV